MEDTFWPEVHARAELYRGYKRLINSISEKLHKNEALSLAYQHDLPAWFKEVGPMQEPGYALRVLSQLEAKQVFSPSDLGELFNSLEAIQRIDLANAVRAFEDLHKDVMETNNYTVRTPDPFIRQDHRRASVGTTTSTRRYYQDTFRQSRTHTSSLDRGLDQHISASAGYGRYNYTENRTRHESTDKYSMDRSREGTPFESIPDLCNGEHMNVGTCNGAAGTSIPHDVNIGIEMSKMSTETLSNQLQLIQKMLASYSHISPTAYHAITNAFLLTKQICSQLNIASDSIRMVPVATRCPTGSYDNMCPSPYHSRNNSSSDLIKSGNSSNYCDHFTNGSGSVDTQKDTIDSSLQRSHSQPQVLYNTERREIRCNISTSSSQGERSNGEIKAANNSQLSPLEFTDMAFRETDSPDYSNIMDDLPPPLPPRPRHMMSPSIDISSNPRPIVERCTRQPITNHLDQLSPITKYGYHLMKSSHSVENLSKFAMQTECRTESRSKSKSLKSRLFK